jgi:hypothetical protein
LTTEEEEELRILERAQFLYELGIPGGCMGMFLLFIAPFFDVWWTVATTGLVISALSISMIQLGKYYKDKVLP